MLFFPETPLLHCILTSLPPRSLQELHTVVLTGQAARPVPPPLCSLSTKYCPWECNLGLAQPFRPGLRGLPHHPVSPRVWQSVLCGGRGEQGRRGAGETAAHTCRQGPDGLAEKGYQEHKPSALPTLGRERTERCGGSGWAGDSPRPHSCYTCCDCPLPHQSPRPFPDL